MGIRPIAFTTVAACLLTGLLLASPASAQNVPRSLRGKIVVNAQPIDTSSKAKNFAKKMLAQDKKSLKKDSQGKWTLHFVAFFNKACSTKKLGIVVLDAKQEPVALADLEAQEGQTTLATHIVVDSTESPGKKHTLQVYYTKNNKPVVLAQKKIVLK